MTCFGAVGKVRITDFDLAILEQDERERGVVAGTSEYMAPEQLAAGEATAKSDIYALGLYELFTGVRVWSVREEHPRPSASARSRFDSLIVSLPPR